GAQIEQSNGGFRLTTTGELWRNHAAFRVLGGCSCNGVAVGGGRGGAGKTDSRTTRPGHEKGRPGAASARESHRRRQSGGGQTEPPHAAAGNRRGADLLGR